MDLITARHFLHNHVSFITAFMDYIPRYVADDKVAADMRHWLNNAKWDDGTYRFSSLGFDGTGGQFLACQEGEQPSCVVLVGSEGGVGILAGSLSDWVEIVAHAPFIDEFGEPAKPCALPVKGAKARDAQARYKHAVEFKLGHPVRDLSTLLEGLEAPNEAFRSWMASKLQTVSMMDLSKHGLNGGTGSKALRRAVAERLGLRPTNAKGFVKQLNASTVTRVQFEAALKDIT